MNVHLPGSVVFVCMASVCMVSVCMASVCMASVCCLFSDYWTVLVVGSESSLERS